jgi:hypothetical protein
VDRLRFENRGKEIKIDMATNFYTLKPGLGGFLWLQWMKNCSVGLVFGGSDDSHKILKRQKFTYYPDVNTYTLNATFISYPGDAQWKKITKKLLRALMGRRLRDLQTHRPGELAAMITVKEIPSEAGRQMENSCFLFHFAPTNEYLRWRYNSTLDVVHYRWFDLFEGGVRIGYCVLNDASDQIIVAHSDGTDAQKLAYGTLKAIFVASTNDRSKRSALLVSSHPEMQAIFTRAGFRQDGGGRPVAIGSLRSKVELPQSSEWLINFGVGDNDLRTSTFHQSVARK